MAGLSPPVVALCAALAVVMTTIGDAGAQSDDVYVVTAGAIDELPVLYVDQPPDEPASIEGGSALPLSLSDADWATYSDIAVLPGGHLMVGDGDGRRAVIFDEQGHQVDAFGDAGQYRRPPGIVAAGYIAPNQPELLLFGDELSGQLLLYDTIDETNIWNFGLTHQGAPGHIEQAVALADNRTAVAVEWPEDGLSSVQVLPFDDGAQPELTLVSDADTEFSDTTVVDDLHPVRDVFGDGDGGLLITSRDTVQRVDADGDVTWRFDIGDDTDIGGQFEAGRILESGLIVAATRQPGVWNEAHTNHRLHLLDPERDDPRVDTSPVLDGAPVQFDVAGGHGGTGTLGYYADAFGDPGPSPSALTVEPGPDLTPRPVAFDESAELSFSLRNDTEESIALRGIELRVGDAGCDELDDHHEFDFIWWSDDERRHLEAGESPVFSESGLAADELMVGHWCAALVVIGRDGQPHRVGDGIDIEITPPRHGADEPVVSDDPGDVTGPDAGFPALPDDEPEGAGCGCSQSATTPTAMLAAILMILALSAARPRSLQRTLLNGS